VTHDRLFISLSASILMCNGSALCTRPSQSIYKTVHPRAAIPVPLSQCISGSLDSVYPNNNLSSAVALAKRMLAS
jgi:hypothetical protein